MGGDPYIQAFGVLGQLAAALNPYPYSIGGTLGQAGYEANQAELVRREMKKQKKKEEKAKKSELLGNLGSTLGTAAGFLIPGVGPIVGPMIGSAIGGAAGKAAGGGGLSLEQTAMDAMKGGVSGWTLNKLPGLLGGTETGKAAGQASAQASGQAASDDWFKRYLPYALAGLGYGGLY